MNSDVILLSLGTGVGGDIAEAGDDLFLPLAAEMDRVEWSPHGHSVPIPRAALGEWAEAVGAATNARQISNLKSQISNLKSQISNLKSQISNFQSSNHVSHRRLPPPLPRHH